MADGCSPGTTEPTSDFVSIRSLSCSWMKTGSMKGGTDGGKRRFLPSPRRRFMGSFPGTRGCLAIPTQRRRTWNSPMERESRPMFSDGFGDLCGQVYNHLSFPRKSPVTTRWLAPGGRKPKCTVTTLRTIRQWSLDLVSLYFNLRPYKSGKRSRSSKPSSRMDRMPFSLSDAKRTGSFRTEERILSL